MSHNSVSFAVSFLFLKASLSIGTRRHDYLTYVVYMPLLPIFERATPGLFFPGSLGISGLRLQSPNLAERTIVFEKKDQCLWNFPRLQELIDVLLAED